MSANPDSQSASHLDAPPISHAASLPPLTSPDPLGIGVATSPHGEEVFRYQNNRRSTTVAAHQSVVVQLEQQSARASVATPAFVQSAPVPTSVVETPIPNGHSNSTATPSASISTVLLAQTNADCCSDQTPFDEVAAGASCSSLNLAAPTVQHLADSVPAVPMLESPSPALSPMLSEAGIVANSLAQINEIPAAVVSVGDSAAAVVQPTSVADVQQKGAPAAVVQQIMEASAAVALVSTEHPSAAVNTLHSSPPSQR